MSTDHGRFEDRSLLFVLSLMKSLDYFLGFCFVLTLVTSHMFAMITNSCLVGIFICSLTLKLLNCCLACDSFMGFVCWGGVLKMLAAVH